MAHSSVMVLDRGDLPSLAAVAIQNDPASVVLWHLAEPDAAESRRRAAVSAHAEAWGIQQVISAVAVDPGIPGMAPPPDLYKSIMLLQAATAALQLGCRRIVWPEQVGPDGEAVARSVDRASTAAALADLGSERPTVGIELPLIDLTDEQVVELIDETGAPLGAAWPCAAAGERPCRSCPPCRRWIAAFRELRLDWPWGGDAGSTRAAG